jgi:hypothetical protein
MICCTGTAISARRLNASINTAIFRRSNLQRADVLRDPAIAARQIDDFLGGGLDAAKMAAVVDPALHRQRR